MDIFKNMPLFVEVAKTRSFRRAADALEIPTSTVSRRISELERDIGLRLFNRTTRRVELTDSGRVYFGYCERIIQEAQLAHQELANMLAQPTGIIRASLPVDFSVMHLTPLLMKFTQLYPNIQFNLELTPSLANLVSEPMDIAIRMKLPTEQNLIARNIASLSMGLFASQGYLENRGIPKHPKDLLEHECLRMTDDHWVLNHLSGDNSQTIAVRGQFIANNLGMLRQLALNDRGIMITADNMAYVDVSEHKLIRVLPDWSPPTVQVYALTTTRLLPAKIRIFIDFLIEQLANPIPHKILSV